MQIEAQLNALGKMARLSRQRSMDYPANPTCLADLSIPPHLLLSRGQEDMLLWDSGYTPELRRSVLFGTKTDMDMLHLSDHLLIDGTFKSAPDMFTQLVVTHGLMEDGWRFPLSFGLLPGKTEVLYTNLFEQLDQQGPFYPQTVMCDYELALQVGFSFTIHFIYYT